ncbi:MAG: YdcF family protein [Atopobiaceae bacterium]|nr:YdcF family protein [Atopobiaceae bacterium]
MTNAAAGAAFPPKGLWRRFLLLIPLVAAMAVGCYAHIRSVCSTYEAWTPVFLDDNGEGFDRLGLDDVHIGNTGVVRATDIAYGADGTACVTFEAVADGTTDVTFGDDKLSTYWSMEVRNGAVLCAGINFSGWKSILVCICILFGVSAALCASVLVQLKRTRWFDYGMVAACGGTLFLFSQFLLFTLLLVHGGLRSFSDLAYMLTSAADVFALVGLVPMALLCLLVSLSNLVLIRREGMRPVNLLGIIVSVLWLAAMWLWNEWWTIAAAASMTAEMAQLVQSAIAVAIAYGECLLLATMLCAWMASRLEPAGAMDYLVVLGCGIRADGTPSPLLAGRVDRAREFDAACVEAGGAPATFVPSGGQGPDEVISEAQSMRDYLVSCGVGPDRIVLEDRPATTNQNMEFSREVIEEHAGRDASELLVGFSTTNYHVFRGYVCAHRSGMAVQGMGSRTRAYFWPNAFLREFAGLLASRWKGVLVTYAAIESVYALAEYALLLMGQASTVFVA